MPKNQGLFNYDSYVWMVNVIIVKFIFISCWRKWLILLPVTGRETLFSLELPHDKSKGLNFTEDLKTKSQE